MPHIASQTFLRELDKKLRNAADKLRSNLDLSRQRETTPDAAVYKPKASDTGIPACSSVYEEAIRAELEERDYDLGKNVFRIPALARWKTLQDSAKLPAGKEIFKERGRLARSYKITSTGKLIADALEAVEKENTRNGDLPPAMSAALPFPIASSSSPARAIRRSPLPNLVGLIDLIATIPFQHADLHAKDILGHVYDWSGATKSLPEESPKGERGGAHQYFLGQFALAEGKKGGQYFTPKSIVSLIVEMIESYQGRVYDPAMGSGGFFVQSERFIEEHGGTIGDIMVFGQDQWAWGAHLRRAPRSRRERLRRKKPNQSNPTARRLAAMNMAKSLPRYSEMTTGAHIVTANLPSI